MPGPEGFNDRYTKNGSRRAETQAHADWASSLQRQSAHPEQPVLTGRQHQSTILRPAGPLGFNDRYTKTGPARDEVLQSVNYTRSIQPPRAEPLFSSEEQFQTTLQSAPKAMQPFNAIEHIKQMEGTKRDKKGKFITFPDPSRGTLIGYGHLLSKEELKRGTIRIGDTMVNIKDGLTEEQANRLLEQDAGYHGRQAKRVMAEHGIVWENLPPEIQAVAQDLTYQVGPGGFQKFKPFLSAVRDENWTRARQHVGRTYVDRNTGRRVKDTRRTKHAQSLIDRVIESDRQSTTY